MAINDVSLTSGMRSNLLSLQNTVSLLDRTQTRLSSGKKVNTAIDNPTSYFASKALTDRASVIDSLKDAMGQAVQTITAADKGITAITSMIEQAKGIAQSALSAESSTGFSTVSLTLDGVANGDSVTIAGQTLVAGPTAVVTTYGSYSLALSGVDVQAGEQINVGGIAYTGVATAGTTTNTSFDVNLAGVAVNDTVEVGGITYTGVANSYTTTNDSIDITFTSAAVGDHIIIGGVSYLATAGATSIATEFNQTSAAAAATDLAAKINLTQGAAFTATQVVAGVIHLHAGTSPVSAATLGAGEAVASAAIAETHNDLVALTDQEFLVTAGDASTTATALRAKINALQGAAYTAAGAAGMVNIVADAGTTLTATSVDATIAANPDALTANTTYAGPVINIGEFLITGNDAADALALQAAINLNQSALYDIAMSNENKTLTITAKAGAADLTATTVEDVDSAIGITSVTATTAGALTDLEFNLTSSNIVNAINLADRFNNATGTAALVTAGWTATADNGVVTIAKLEGGTAAADVTMAANVTASAASITRADVAASSDLTDLVDQFNEMKVQIDELAEDSGYKGKNLLSATAALRQLNVVFEGATLSVQGFDATTGAAGLNITSALNGAATTWTSGTTAINASIDQLDAALSTLRAQSSKLSGNLSIITVRQDFSTNMINTLTSGSDKLTLADANEEGANMLMLQTRQSLSTTALSLSAQAAQSVLKLFG